MKQKEITLNLLGRLFLEMVVCGFARTELAKKTWIWLLRQTNDLTRDVCVTVPIREEPAWACWKDATQFDGAEISNALWYLGYYCDDDRRTMIFSSGSGSFAETDALATVGGFNGPNGLLSVQRCIKAGEFNCSGKGVTLWVSQERYDENAFRLPFNFEEIQKINFEELWGDFAFDCESERRKRVLFQMQIKRKEVENNV